MFSAVSNIPCTFSWTILLVLLVILAASGRVFFILTRQWTAQRPMQALREWAGDHRFKLQLPAAAALPQSLLQIAALDPQIETLSTRGPEALIRLSTAGKPASPRPVWNLLIRQTGRAQSPAGLRPATAAASFLDLFSLNGFPSMLPPERFIVFATDSRDARRLAATSALGLLPPDIGLLIHGPYVTLDFSTRPFDTIEFDRMLVILDQIIQADK